MIGKIKAFFGLGPSVNIAELIRSGATILDVRSKSEYSGGHVRGSLNIPLDQLNAQFKKLRDKDHPVITCCASGMRSASAKNFLRAQGFTNVHNGGSWLSVNRHLR